MNFDTKRLSQLAGISDCDSDSEVIDVAPVTRAPMGRPQRLVEGQSYGDEKQLRLIIRREARRMIQERLQSPSGKKSLTEAIALGFPGMGFGGTSPVLGGPMTSARNVASYDTSEASDDDSVSDVAFDMDRWMALAMPRRR
jgi:hypothetical protein